MALAIGDVHAPKCRAIFALETPYFCKVLIFNSVLHLPAVPLLYAFKLFPNRNLKV
jgi:hypothetical protein